MPMNQSHGAKKGGGCGLVAVIGGVVLLIAVVPIAILMLLWTRKATVMDEAETMERAESVLQASAPYDPNSGREQNGVVITESRLASLAVADFGSELSREQFIAVMTDDHATDLTRQQFKAKADGQQVEWLLKVRDVDAPGSDGSIKAEFKIPYSVSYGGHSMMSSSLTVRAEFPPEAVDDLEQVRREQWVTVAGSLKVEQPCARIRSARLVGPPAKAPAEREN